MKRCVIITGHFPNEKRRSSLHWVAHHLQRFGWHVTFVTVGYSRLSKIWGDKRLKELPVAPDVGMTNYAATLSGYFSIPMVHPVQFETNYLNRLSASFGARFTNYWAHHLTGILRSIDLVIVESGPGVLLARTLERQCPDIPRIYRVNDDINFLRMPQSVIDAEINNMKTFTRISTSSPLLAAKFDGHDNVTIDAMGVPKEKLTRTFIDPYEGEGPRAVCAGSSHIDIAAVEKIAQARPDWQIHVVGRVARKPRGKNIKWHGEQPFDAILPYIAHANVALAPYVDRPSIEYQRDNSNRILLYRHFGLPILAPERLTTQDIPALISYNDSDCFDRCMTWQPKPEDLPDWSELAMALVKRRGFHPQMS